MGGEGREEGERGKLKGKGRERERTTREWGREVREANNSSPAATVHLGLLALSVVQETGWHQGAQHDKRSGRRSLCQSLCTLCQDTVSSISKIFQYCLNTVNMDLLQISC